MSKRNKSRSKNKRSPSVPAEQLPRRNRRRQWEQVVDRADGLIARSRWSEARQVLEEYECDCPGHPIVLRRLLDVYHAERDYGPYCRTCRRLLDAEPGDPFLHLMLADGYLNDARPASALRAFRRFLDHWPDDSFADGARETVAQLEPVVDEMLEDISFPDVPGPKDNRLDLAAMHEEMRVCLSAAEHEQVVVLGERLLSRIPQFVPAMNNLGEGYFWTGRTDKAVAIARRVLDVDPDNFHAMANLSRYLLLGGRLDEARAACERLRAASSERLDIWAKKAETFSLFGDDQAVLDAMDGARAPAARSSKTRTSRCCFTWPRLPTRGKAGRRKPDASGATPWRSCRRWTCRARIWRTRRNQSPNVTARGHSASAYWLRQETIGGYWPPSRGRRGARTMKRSLALRERSLRSIPRWPASFRRC